MLLDAHSPWVAKWVVSVCGVHAGTWVVCLRCTWVCPRLTGEPVRGVGVLWPPADLRLMLATVLKRSPLSPPSMLHEIPSV